MRRESSLGLFSFIYCGLLCIVASAISRRNGFAWVLAGLVALALALRRYRGGRPETLYRVCYALLLAAATALGIEALLWLRPSLLEGAVANKLYSRMHVYTGGVYERDRHIGYSMRPDCHALTYWNGYWWRHDTNAAGFRGPALEHAEA